VLVAAVTYVTASNSVENDWTSVAAAVTEPRWLWAPVGGAVAVTLLRHWSPAVALVAAAALFGWWPASAVALALAAFEAAGSVPRRRAALLAAATATGFAVSLLSSRMPLLMVTELHLITAVVCLVLPAWARARLTRADSAARVQERSRIAEEMHDRLGHRLSLISMYAGALEVASARSMPARSAEATLIRSTAQTAMQELRGTLGLLGSRDRAGATGRRPDVERLVCESRAAGVDVALTWSGSDLAGVAAPVRDMVHRIVREGLTNIHRHAAGSAATVVIEHRRRTVRVRIANGRGTPAAAGTGLGLAGIRAEVRRLGGDFAAGPTRDGGFRVTAVLPRHPPPADRRPRHAPFPALAAGLSGVAALVIVALTYLPWYSAEYQTVTEPPPDPVLRVGMTRAEVSRAFGPDDPVARLAARAVESPPPAGGSCLYGTEWTPDTSISILRYCFRADLLISIDRFRVAGGVSAVGP